MTAGKTLLIAEDERVLRESDHPAGGRGGDEVVQAGIGREACDLLLNRHVDIVLSDVRMPEMNGLELLDQVKRVAPQTPVIMMTAYATVDSAVKAMRRGAWDYLLKPVQFDDLLLKIQRAMEFE